MKRESVIDPSLLGELSDACVIGIDIGSRASKAVLLADGQLFTAIVPTGVNTQITAEELLDELFDTAGRPREAVEYIVGTGYGRVALQFDAIPSEIVTEISCHAMGAHFLNAGTRTIVDIGGQDSKVIQVDPDTGKVAKFVMNDKCAAGTGRFLEKAAGLLEYTIHELGPASLNASKELPISSQCVVFAESEIISMRARDESREDIAAGLHLASARRVVNLLSRIPLDADLVFTGGVSNNVGMRKALEKLVGHAFAAPRLDMVYAGALGAAIHAQRFAAESRRVHDRAARLHVADLSDLSRRIEDAETSLIERRDTPKAGYLCTYTPVELLSAAGIAFARLAKCGSSDAVAQGELLTKSVFCDLTKSLLGQFMLKEPLHEAVDRVFTFYTCSSMKATAEALDNFFKPTHGYLVPRSSERQSARTFFREEILHFRKDLENWTGRAISDEQIREEIRRYNRIRRRVRDISALRKRNNPPLSGRDFLELARAFRTLPPAELLPLLDDVYARLSAVAEDDHPRLRLMVSGGVMADGDRRIMDLLEDHLGCRVVVEDHCTGLGPFYHDTPETDDPWQDLADAYLDQAPCARQAPLSRRVDFSAQLATDYAVDGVVYSYLMFCPGCGLSKHSFIKRFQELFLPVLELPSDYSQGDTGQIKTRLEAFVEVLQENKRGAACP
jgi:predicted CoA-substrate-specific enzyme activase